MSEFVDRARAEAEGRWSVKGIGRTSLAINCRNEFVSGAIWAARQPPTDAEVEAADKAFHEVIMSGEWVTQEQAIRAALSAAQKVRAGQ